MGQLAPTQAWPVRDSAACTLVARRTQQFFPRWRRPWGDRLYHGLRPPWLVAPPRGLRPLKPLSIVRGLRLRASHFP